MADARLTPANAQVAALELSGEVEAPRYEQGDWRSIAIPVADLALEPGGPRSRQLIFGTRVRVLDTYRGDAFVQSSRDGYVGYVDAAALGPATAATHRVTARASHLYDRPDMKSGDRLWMSHGALLEIEDRDGGFLREAGGFWVPAGHVKPVDEPARDAIDVAALYLGTPYLWGGNTSMGIDCSGLVQAALLACDIPCPGDSDMQHASLGEDLPLGTPAERGDLFFWPGHVALAVDSETLIHANAHHMAVAIEPMGEALARIAASDTGDITAHKRLHGTDD